MGQVGFLRKGDICNGQPAYDEAQSAARYDGPVTHLAQVNQTVQATAKQSDSEQHEKRCEAFG